MNLFIWIVAPYHLSLTWLLIVLAGEDEKNMYLQKIRLLMYIGEL